MAERLEMVLKKLQNSCTKRLNVVKVAKSWYKKLVHKLQQIAKKDAKNYKMLRKVAENVQNVAASIKKIFLK